MSAADDSASVLIVDDEHVAETYKIRLEGSYDVDYVTGGTEALQAADDEYDVVLLDRRMPDVSGDEVLEAIRDRELDLRVVMVTAVDPDFDLLEMQCDDYVVKPIERGELQDIVERVLRIGQYSDRRQKLGAKKLKRNVLEVEMRERELEANEEYQKLQREIEELEAEVDELEDELGLEQVDRFL